MEEYMGELFEQRKQTCAAAEKASSTQGQGKVDTEELNSIRDNSAHNAAMFEALKEQYRMMEASNEVIESLQKTGKLPNDYITKSQAELNGWKRGKALNNTSPGKK